MNKNFKVIAEIGCTHIGSLKRAKMLSKLAKLCGADVLKTQKRNPKESTNKDLWDKPHPNEMYSYGKTYLEHRENVELHIEDHYKLKKYCEEIEIEYSTSVWDMTSAKEIVELNPNFIKIPSALNMNEELFNFLINNYKGKIHISTGMLDLKERIKLYSKLQKYNDRIVIYHCTSGYPVPFNKLYLKEISKLANEWDFDNIGYSNHGLGVAMFPVALTLGANHFEVHFIDDRLFKHTDSAASIEPQGLSKIVRDLKAAEQALQFKPEILDDIENIQKNKLRTD